MANISIESTIRSANVVNTCELSIIYQSIDFHDLILLIQNLTQEKIKEMLIYQFCQIFVESKEYFILDGKN